MTTQTQPYNYKLPNPQDVTPASALAEIPRRVASFTADIERVKALPTPTDASSATEFLHAYDEAYRALYESLGPIGTMISAVGGSQWDEVAAKLSNQVAQLRTQMLLDDALCARFKALADLELDPASAYLVDRELLQFRLGGIDLPSDQRQELAQLNLLIADTAVEYQRRVSLMLARDLEVGGEHFPTNNFTLQLALARLDDPATRRALLAASLERGWGSDPETDTRELVTRIVDARNRRAQLLGFSNHAQLVTEGAVAPSTEAIWKLLTDVCGPAWEAVNREAEQLRQLACRDGVEDFNAADWLYYQQQGTAKETEDATAATGAAGSDEPLERYFELWTVVERGVFKAAHELYGITLVRRDDLTAWDEGIRTYDVYDADGSSLGLFVADYFARPGKSGGAWMDSLVRGYRGNQFRSVVVNCANFERHDERPTLLEWDQVVTCFHEFGHALHGFLSHTDYWLSAGTAVPRDFVELPSQLNEMWAYHPQILDAYAVHVDTGEALPSSLREQLLQRVGAPQGYETAEYLAAAILDLAWYSTVDREGLTPEEFEAETLNRFGFGGDLVYPRYRTTYFPHAFTTGYDAAYNSYMWAETLVGECEQWFRSEGAHGEDGGLNRDAGQRLREVILSRGYSRDPGECIQELLGRQPSAGAVLRRRGL